MDQLSKNVVDALHEDILSEILSIVGQESSAHLSVARLACKAFRKQSEHFLVFRRLSLDRWPILAWGYFDGVYTDLGLRYLEEASNCQLKEAVYVYGLNMFSSQYLEKKDKGFKILNARFPKLPDLVVSVRMNVYGLLQQLWRRNLHPFADLETMCPISGHRGYFPRVHGFELTIPVCISCFWAYELEFFINRFRYN
ncbi:putative F-box protein At1g67623 [Rutidosis leptorrhynchoides]|uniref:putative F-box protein At1g67623 n=1 Tax=Rutidosis leptorrhynchoides TaxID=125765 RepID=UPI003A9905FD